MEIYFSPGLMADIKASVGKAVSFTGQWVDDLFFDVWSVVG